MIITGWAASAAAIGLAIVAAFCFAFAATFQHGAIHGAGSSQRFGVRMILDLVRSPGWLTGLALAGAGTGLSVIALILAPVSVVQPVGVLAVPIAVLITARRHRIRPSQGVLAGVAVSVLSTASFVWLAADHAVAVIPNRSDVVVAAIVVASLVAVLALVSVRSTSGWMRCIASAAGGAVAFGCISVMLRAISQQVLHGGSPLHLLVGHPSVLIMAVGIVTAVMVGGLLVQQGFASGPPEVVVGSLTVIDPVVAVTLGVVLLGEGANLSGWTAMAMAAAAVLAAGGVITLAKHHPDAQLRRTEGQLASPVFPMITERNFS